MIVSALLVYGFESLKRGGKPRSDLRMDLLVHCKSSACAQGRFLSQLSSPIPSGGLLASTQSLLSLFFPHLFWLKLSLFEFAASMTSFARSSLLLLDNTRLFPNEFENISWSGWRREVTVSSGRLYPTEESQSLCTNHCYQTAGSGSSLPSARHLTTTFSTGLKRRSCSTRGRSSSSSGDHGAGGGSECKTCHTANSHLRQISWHPSQSTTATIWRCSCRLGPSPGQSKPSRNAQKTP